jgi:hypothetical protein
MTEQTQISPSLLNYLLEMRTKLASIEDSHKMLNTYRWLYTPTPSKNRPVCKINITCPSFFDFIEIIYTMHLNNLFDTSVPLHSFHFTKNNIGAIESLQKIRNHNKSDIYVSNDSFGINIPNVLNEPATSSIIDYFNHCFYTRRGTMDLITADSTVEFYSGKKGVISGMMQICLAVTMQKKNGIFIMKVDDSFSMAFLDMVCFLSFFYEKTYFIQPSTIDITTSSKYIVCKGFLHSPPTNILEDDFYIYIYKIWMRMFAYVTAEPKRLLSINIPSMFIGKLEEINSIFGQPELERMSQMVTTISNHSNRPDKIHYLIKQNIQKCIEWCIKYHIIYQT